MGSANRWMNEYKRRLVLKSPTKSSFKNFLLIVYLLYFRYTVEFGISVMTLQEAIIVNLIFGFILLSTWIRLFRFTFILVRKAIIIILDLLWIYKNFDEIKKISKSLPKPNS